MVAIDVDLSAYEDVSDPRPWVARSFVIFDVDLVVDAKALTLTAAKRHVVLDPTVAVARGPRHRAASRRCDDVDVDAEVR
jgi:hypothetical protein